MKQDCEGCASEMYIKKCILMRYKQKCPCSECLIKSMCAQLCGKIMEICLMLHKLEGHDVSQYPKNRTTQ